MPHNPNEDCVNSFYITFYMNIEVNLFIFWMKNLIRCSDKYLNLYYGLVNAKLSNNIMKILIAYDAQE